MRRMLKWIAAPALLATVFAFGGISQADAGGFGISIGGYGGHYGHGYYGNRSYYPSYGYRTYRPYYSYRSYRPHYGGYNYYRPYHYHW